MNPDNRSRATADQLAATFLKPLSPRQRALLAVADALTRPIVRLFPLKSGKPARAVDDILIFEPGLLGDIVMLVPFLQNLRACYPASRIALLGRSGPSETLLAKRLLDEVIAIPIPWRSQVSRWKRNNPLTLNWLRFFKDVLALRSRKFDLGFAAGWSGDFRGNVVLWLAGAKIRVGYGYAGGKHFLTDIAVPDVRRPHVVDRNLQLLSHLGIPVVPFQDALPLAEHAKASAKRLLAHQGITPQDLVVGIHPGAGAEIREWGDERFAAIANQLANRFGAKILWFSDPQKPKPLPLGLKATPLALSLPDFEATVAQCQLFICNDSGPMHLAAALKIPVIAVFGAQRPEWFGPWGEGHKVAIRPDMWCRPCADNCIFDQPYCLRLVSVDHVFQQAEQIIQNLAPSRRTATVR